MGLRRSTESRNGISGIVPRPHSGQQHSCDGRNPTGDPDRAGHICSGCRSRQRWVCGQSGKARRQHDRVHEYRLRYRHEMAGLLKEIAPDVTRVGVIRDPTVTSSIGQLAAIQAAARTFGVEVSALGGREAKDIERTVSEFARGSSGLITVAVPLSINNRELIISLAARHRLPTVYPFRTFVAEGGLASYGYDSIDPYRQAAGYVDRILKGAKPADLPVQGATKYNLTINLKTAKALGLTISRPLVARADEVIE